MRQCTTPGCEAKHYAKGCCRAHYFSTWRKSTTAGQAFDTRRKAAQAARRKAERDAETRAAVDAFLLKGRLDKQLLTLAVSWLHRDMLESLLRVRNLWVSENGKKRLTTLTAAESAKLREVMERYYKRWKDLPVEGATPAEVRAALDAYEKKRDD